MVTPLQRPCHIVTKTWSYHYKDVVTANNDVVTINNHVVTVNNDVVTPNNDVVTPSIVNLSEILNISNSTSYFFNEANNFLFDLLCG
jgi:hypothetical protein